MLEVQPEIDRAVRDAMSEISVALPHFIPMPVPMPMPMPRPRPR
jgi:hypothetical protein